MQWLNRAAKLCAIPGVACMLEDPVKLVEAFWLKRRLLIQVFHGKKKM
jgi:hypothetical protein